MYRHRRRARAWATAAFVAAPLLGLILGAASAPPPRDGLDWPGIHLGMALDDWKALPFPGEAGRPIAPACRPDGAPASLPLARTASGGAADVTVCVYRDRLGRLALAEPVSLGPKWQARQLRFTFVGGRLAKVEYEASVDAFNDLLARLDQRFGPPANIQRDTLKTEAGGFPRVRMSWNTPEGLIQLTDPVPPFNVLSVGLSAPASKPGRPS